MADPPNVVLVVFDAMRRDALGLYGANTPTPNIDLFSREASVYPDCITPSPWTIPSHLSLFSGKYPSEHGVHETREKKAIDLLGMASGFQGETLAESLKKKGYQTIGLPANSLLTIGPGFDRGFDVFASQRGTLWSEEDMALVRTTFEKGRTRSAIVWDFVRRGQFAELVRVLRVVRKIRKLRARSNYPHSKYGDIVVDKVKEARLEPPFLLFLNFMEMHDPYVDYELGPENRGPFSTVGAADLYGYRPIGDDEMARIRQGYYSNASVLDAHFGRLLSTLKEKGVYDNTVMVVTSDHGQALKERGYYGHGTFLHDEILRIPLIVKGANGRKPEVGAGHQSLVGVPAFILDSAEGGSDAASLSSEVVMSESFGTQHAPPLRLPPPFAESADKVRTAIDRPLKAAYKDGLRMVVNPTSWKVEELQKDGRPTDLSAHLPDVEMMMTELKRLDDSASAVRQSAPAFTPEEEGVVSERLRELGYL